MKETIYFCDFDGTIAIKDIGNELHKRFSSPQWRTPNKAYLTGKISSRECLWSQYEFFRGHREEVEAFVLEHEIDSTFRDFARWTREHKRKIIILSDGLGFYIQLLLEKYGVEGMTWFSNRAEFEGDRVRIHYPHFDPDCRFGCQCGNCKPSHMKGYENHRKVFIGDGISDRHAAQAADFIYAKGRLVHFCNELGAPYVQFETFSDIILHEEKGSGLNRSAGAGIRKE